jgi:hypothetical protein
LSPSSANRARMSAEARAATTEPLSLSTVGFGVPFGANNANQLVRYKPAAPPIDRRYIWLGCQAVLRHNRKRLQLSGAHLGQRIDRRIDQQVDLVGPARILQKDSAHMLRAANAGGPDRRLAGPSSTACRLSLFGTGRKHQNSRAYGRSAERTKERTVRNH